MGAINSFEITAPEGKTISIPVSYEPVSDPYPSADDAGGVKAHYDEHGYVVVRGLIDRDLCPAVLAAYTREMKGYEGYLYRQPSSGRAEKHIFSNDGYLLNSVLNVHDLSPSAFGAFRQAVLDVVINPRLTSLVRAIMGEEPLLVQTMFFEGNPVTWAHQDTYYLDSTDLGRQVAAWIALEDIHPGAGRFYVYPGSHHLDVKQHGGDFDIAFNHERYKQLIIELIETQGLTCTAPALTAGDVLLWSSKTIHGSLETRTPDRSRSSLTVHFIPASTKLMQFQRRPMKMHVERVGETLVHHPKDQRKLSNRLVLDLETRFPRAYGAARNLAIKLVTR